MNNKGFTLIELLAVLVLIATIVTISGFIITGTFSATRESSYDLMKRNIISASRDYVSECQAGTLNCNLVWTDNTTVFYASNLLNAGYFTNNLINPKTDEDISQCLIIEVTLKNGKKEINLNDSKCKKE